MNLGGVYGEALKEYYLISGQSPSGSDMRNQLKSANENLTDSQIDIVMRCLSGNINSRYNDCNELDKIVCDAYKGEKNINKVL